MHIRKLVKAGESSHTVSLPKSWLQKHNLSKGDTVFITEQPDVLLISPQSGIRIKNEKSKEISIANKDIATIQREITGAYVNNYNTITLVGPIDECAKEIREVVHEFVALEITEQTSKRIVAKNMLNIEEVSGEQTLRRMDMIIRSMFLDLKEMPKNIHKSLVVRDLDVNRLYFLMLRILKLALEDNAAATAIGIDKKDILTVWDMTTCLENIADAMKNISSLAVQEKKWFVEACTIVESSYLKAVKAYYTNNKELAHAIAQSREENEKAIRPTKQTTAEISQIFRSMLTLINDIARLVMDRDD